MPIPHPTRLWYFVLTFTGSVLGFTYCLRLPEYADLSEWLSPWVVSLSKDYLLFVILCGLLSFAIGFFVLSWICLLILYFFGSKKVPILPKRLIENKIYDTGFKVPFSYLKYLGFTLDLEWIGYSSDFVQLEVIKGCEYCTFKRRGIVNSPHRLLAIKDPFHFTVAYFSLPHPTPNEHLCIPQYHTFDPTPSLDLHSYGEGDTDSKGKRTGDWFDIRMYQMGDPANRVLWKKSSGSPHLLVRQPEPVISKKVMVFFWTASSDQANASLLLDMHQNQLFGLSCTFKIGTESLKAPVEEELEFALCIDKDRSEHPSYPLEQITFFQKSMLEAYQSSTLFIVFIPPQLEGIDQILELDLDPQQSHFLCAHQNQDSQKEIIHTFAQLPIESSIYTPL